MDGDTLACREYRPGQQADAEGVPLCLCGWPRNVHPGAEADVSDEAFLADLGERYPGSTVTITRPSEEDAPDGQ